MGRRAVLLHTVAAALGAAGCQAATQEASQMVVVSSEQDGATVALRAGGRLQLRLPAQLGTGYSWAPDPSPGLLRLDGQWVASPAELRPGGTETQVLDFTATGAGSETLLLAYRRPWEPAAPARRFRLRVEIAP